jgi:hypothetical protein
MERGCRGKGRIYAGRETGLGKRSGRQTWNFLNADKGGLLRISSKAEDLIQEDLSACIRFYLRSIQVFSPWCVKGNGTQIDAEKAGFTQAEKLD